MKKRFTTIKFNAFILVLLFGLTGLQACAQATKPFSINESPLAAPSEPVNDFAGVLDQNTIQTLNQRIKDFKLKTNPQVVLAVAVVKTTGDRDPSDYSLAVSRGWKIGTKEDDNPSALLFVAIDDRKYFTQVSRNLQDELPDGVIGELQRQYLVPAFRQGNYAKGITDTIEAYIRTIEAKQTGEPAATGTIKEKRAARKESGGFCSIVTCLIILFVLMLMIFSRFGSSNRNRNDRNRWGGGGFGGGGSALPWIVGGVLSSMADNDRSSSGDWGSGGGSSGGGDWGGFGGGGDFDGGGSGGSW